LLFVSLLLLQDVKAKVANAKNRIFFFILFILIK
jgi:hypothetical protein